MISSLEYLITSEKKLVYDIINGYYDDCSDRDDYLNAGFAGLIQAAYRYNLFENSSFKEFCIPYIIESIENVKIKNQLENNTKFV